MRITILTPDSIAFNIDSDNPELLGPWFIDIAKKVMLNYASYTYQTRFQVYPQTEDEIKLVSTNLKNGLFVPLSQDNVLEWAKHLTNLSADLGELEAEK